MDQKTHVKHYLVTNYLNTKNKFRHDLGDLIRIKVEGATRKK